MAAKKSAKKKTAPKKSASKKAATEKESGEGAAKKKATKKKSSAKKASTKAASDEGGKKASAKKKTTKKKVEAKPAEKKAAESSGEAKKTKTGVSSQDVNLGHVFALRPRVNTSFRQEHFRSARHLLEEERFDSLADAARAVAERALELTHDGGTSKPGFKRS